MKRHLGIFLAVAAGAALLGCIGSGGSSAPAPTGVTVVPKDGRVVVTWNMSPGVQYWIFRANGDGVTPQNCKTMPLCYTSINVTSPATLWGLYDGIVYSFSINGRTDGGPGGPGSTAISATPRWAGASWIAGTAQSGTLRGVTYGVGARFVAVGDSGSLLWSTDGGTWAAAATNPAPTTNFNAVSFNATPAKYVAAGAGGVILQSADAVTWTSSTSGTLNPLLALTNNGSGFLVATGANGTIVTSSDGTTWANPASGTTNALNGVTYGIDNTNGIPVFVAVGDAGTVRYSVDGIDWTTKVTTSNTTENLKSVTYGATAGIFVAVGTNGTVITSTDGITWTVLTTSTGTPISATSTATLNAVTFAAGRRFVAVNNSGEIFYSDYGAPTVWTKAAVTPASASALYGVTPGGAYDYSTVGASGVNLYAD